MELKNDTNLVAPSPGHFEMQKLDPNGTPFGNVTRINTESGLVLNSHPKAQVSHIKRIAEMARENPNYPYDISAWDGPENNRRLIWWARIHWRLKGVDHELTNY